MQIVIDVPEESYKFAKECKSKGSSRYDWGLSHDAIVLMIANGTPLPKGHRRLIILSEDRIKENQINLDSSCQKWISEVGLSNATIKIIEADKTESKEKEMKSNTHMVLKIDDIKKYLSDEQICELNSISQTIQNGREKDGKNKCNEYYICNVDEPYSGKVLDVILKAESED